MHPLNFFKIIQNISKKMSLLSLLYKKISHFIVLLKSTLNFLKFETHFAHQKLQNNSFLINRRES